ncbi:MAG: hypothetical protein HUU35_14795 [Armatimonadetes bacterium]|nr:hypothetical protein [Armatimonadota bacterium]
MTTTLYVVGGNEQIALPAGRIRCLTAAPTADPLAALLPTIERFEVSINRAEAPAGWLEFVAHHRGQHVALRCRVGTVLGDDALDAILVDAWRMVFE